MSDAPSGVRLDCRPGRNGRLLTFPYRVENNSPVPIYVMDAYPWLDAATQTMQANEQTVVVVARGDKEALVGKLPPNGPLGRRVHSPWFPLAKQLQPGEALERDFSVRTPLAETSAMLPDLTLREYEVVELEAVIFAVAYWPVGTPELYAAPESFAPDYLRVVATRLVPTMKLAWQRFPVRSLQLFKRTDPIDRAIQL